MQDQLDMMVVTQVNLHISVKLQCKAIVQFREVQQQQQFKLIVIIQMIRIKMHIIIAIIIIIIDQVQELGVFLRTNYFRTLLINIQYLKQTIFYQVLIHHVVIH